jgi:hypothetical protein
MNTYWKHGLTTLVYSLALLSTTSAWAGTRSTKTVVINNAVPEAHGVLSNTRDSEDPMQTIGCRVQTLGLTGSEVLVECEATNAQGQTLACSSTRPAFAKVAQGLPNFGELWFRTNASGECTYLQVRVGSPYLP